jgi:hypothetical protein
MVEQCDHGEWRGGEMSRLTLLRFAVIISLITNMMI